MLKRGLIAGFVIGLVMLASLVFALSKGTGTDIQERYSIGEKLSGQVNISLSNDLASSKFRVEYSKTGYSTTKYSNKTIKEILDDIGRSYTCNPPRCCDDYSLSNEETEKTFTLNNNEKTVAFKFSGANTAFKSLKFDVEITNPDNCNMPVMVDLFDDGAIDLYSVNMTDDFSCLSSSGCFDASQTTDYALIGEAPYCERIKVPVSSKFKLGAWIKKGNFEWYDGLLKIGLYSDEEGLLEECELEEDDITTSGRIAECEIEYSVNEEKELFVCIKAEEDTDYKIKTEDKGEVCGFAGEPGSQTDYTNDFYLTLKTPEYGSTGSFDETSFDDIDDKVREYINEVYDGNCSAGCKIPMRFIAKVNNVNVKINSILLSYMQGSLTRSSDRVYNADKTPLKLSVPYTMINLDSLMIDIPSRTGNYDLELYLGDNLIREDVVIVESLKAIVALFPTTATLKAPTTFRALVESRHNVSAYFWNFGDNTETIQTPTREATHTYNNSGAYSVRVTATINGRNTTSVFNVTVADARTSANLTLSNCKKKLADFENSIRNLTAWEQTALKERINFQNINNILNTLTQQYLSASSNIQFISILNNLSAIRIPSSIRITTQIEIPYVIDYNLIDVAKLSALGAGTTANKQQILGWQTSKADMKVSYKNVQADYDGVVENLGSLINLKVIPKQQESIKNFLVIEGTSAFKENYGQKNITGGYGIAYNDLMNREVEFFNYNVVGLRDIRAYLSPEFSQLEGAIELVCNSNGRCEPELGENSSNCRSDCKPWKTALLIFLFIILIGIGAAVGLLYWYKRNYENYLYKEKTDLFNMMNFIRTAKSQGIERKKIIEELRTQGWNTEQIGYAFMQVEGSIWARLIGKKPY